MNRKSVDLPATDKPPNGEQPISDDDQLAPNAEQTDSESSRSSYATSTSPRMRLSAPQSEAKHPTAAI